MFELIVNGKKYPVADNFAAAKKVADLNLKEKLQSPERAYIAEAFSVATGYGVDESFDIVKSASSSETTDMYINFIKYCAKLSMSDAEREQYENKFNELLKERSEAGDAPEKKKPIRTRTKV